MGSPYHLLPKILETAFIQTLTCHPCSRALSAFLIFSLRHVTHAAVRCAVLLGAKQPSYSRTLESDSSPLQWCAFLEHLSERCKGKCPEAMEDGGWHKKTSEEPLVPKLGMSSSKPSSARTS